MVRIYDDNLSGGTLEFKVSEPGTLRYQIDDTASYADAAAMDAAAGSAQITGSVAAPVGNGTEVIDTSGLAGGLWYIHLVQGATTDSAVVSVSFTKIANTVISVPAGVYTLTGYAPNITIDVANLPIDVDLGTYTLTGHGPNITIQRVITPAAGTYTLTGNAPIITFNRGITVPAGSYTLTGYAPTITVGGGAFHPSDLFSTEEGAVYEIHPDYCFTDAAKTTNATVGDAVYVIEDRSGNGNDAVQATAANRPILRQTGSLYYLDYDGVNDLSTADALGALYSGTDLVVSRFFASDCTDKASGSALAAWNSSTSSTPLVEDFQVQSNGNFIPAQKRDDANALKSTNAGYNILAKYVMGISDSGTSVVPRRDGAAGSGLDRDLGAITVDLFTLGAARRSGSASFYADLHLYGFVVIDRALTADETTNTERWLAGKLGTAANDPSALFAASEAGAWYDPSDLSTLWQDTAGTTPVTTDGQTVARMDDKSGNGINATQATAGSRPTYRTDGTYHWLEFDGTDDALEFTASTITDQEVFLAIQRDRVTASSEFDPVLVVAPGGGSGASADYVRFAYKHNAFGATSGNTILGFGGASGNGDALSGNLSSAEKSVVYWRQETSGQTRYNGANFTTGTPDYDSSGATAAIGTDNFAGNFGKFNFYGMVRVDGPKTQIQIEQTESWLSEKIGVTL